MDCPHSVIATAINTNGVSATIYVNSPSIAHCITAFVDYIAENKTAISIPAEFNIADNTQYSQCYTVEYYPQTGLLTIVSYLYGGTYKSRYTAIIKKGRLIAHDISTVSYDNYITALLTNQLYNYHVA